MSSQFSDFWNYQQYYKFSANTDHYKEQQHNYQQNFYQHGNNYYEQMPCIKQENNKSNVNINPYNEYQKYENLNLLQNCLQQGISSPPSTPNSRINPIDPKRQFDPSRDYNSHPHNFILDSPPKTPNSLSTKQETKPSSPEKPCDSPALRALLTRKDKKPVVFKNNQKDIYNNCYEKPNYYNSGFCEQNSFDSNDCKEVLSPPMAIADAVKSEIATSSLGSMQTDSEYGQHQSEIKMAIGDADIFPWMKTSKGNLYFY